MIRTIRAKFIAGFFVIFCVSFLLLNQVVGEVTRTSNQKIVTQDLIGLKKNSNVYVRQAFAINHFTNNELYFGQMAKEMVNDLQHATASEVSAYTINGKMVYSSDSAAFSGVKDEDLRLALQGETAYTISYDHGLASVMYSYPVTIDGVKVGILRFSKDFSLIYGQSNRILDIIFYSALGIFAAAFLFSYLLSRHVTVPLAGLAKSTSEVAGGNLEVRITSRRRDEIGRLSANFNDMVQRIRSQIVTIERDRDRLETLNKQRKAFFDNVTHELKTPLTSILVYAEIIRKNGEADRAFFDKGMKHIVEESQRLHEMVLKLLEMSRETSGLGVFDRVEAGQIMREVCEAMSFKARRYNKTIRCDVQEQLFVYGQPGRLKQLFINLIDNAIKYGFAHTEISALAELDGDFVHFAVLNTGETIPPDQLANLFEPFYVAQPDLKEAGSAGLGLGIAKAIVEDHGGTIRMLSESQQTIVYAEIPYMKPEML